MGKVVVACLSTQLHIALICRQMSGQNRSWQVQTIPQCCQMSISAVFYPLPPPSTLTPCDIFTYLVYV